MTTIFLSFTSEDRACAGEIRQELEEAGYSVWREPDFPTPQEASYPYMIENGILGCAAVVVLWSYSAASFAWTKRHILIAQRFFKPLVPVRLDETTLPSTLLVDSLPGEKPCGEILGDLLPRLPGLGSIDPLLTLNEQAAHQLLHVRKEAIDQAAAMLQHDDHREEVLAILEYLARNDVMTSVREKAQAVLAATTQQQTVSPPASTRPQDACHLFAVRCKNGHITTFDKRKVCSERTEIMRGLDELILPCATCSEKMAVDVDCEGY